MNKNDHRVRDQALRMAREAAARTKRELKLPQGMGNTVIGSIHDCDRFNFERMLRTYFDKLYVGWNPWKKGGRGCWEIWQEPMTKTPRFQGVFNGQTLYTLEYLPNNFEHHVQDLDFLDYKFIKRLREMDAWENKHLFQQADDKIDEDNDKLAREEEESIRYAIRHHKSAFGKLRDLAKDGYNPLWFFSDQRQGDGEV